VRRQPPPFAQRPPSPLRNARAPNAFLDRCQRPAGAEEAEAEAWRNIEMCVVVGRLPWLAHPLCLSTARLRAPLACGAVPARGRGSHSMASAGLPKLPTPLPTLQTEIDR
jgi:hypothetical protein